MKKNYTEKEILEALKAVNEEKKTGKQTRMDIRQTLDVIDEILEDRYITKEDLETVQETVHNLEDYLELVGNFRRLQQGVRPLYDD